ITHEEPTEVTRRDVLRLTQESAAAARGFGEVIKDAERDLRRRLIVMRAGLEEAGAGETYVTVEVRARFLGEVDRIASLLGARCPAPITPAEARTVDQTLKVKTGRTGDDASAGPNGGTVLP
ncbi:MAG: hypothetical protein Q7T55_08095, partial [Solirubrobacteraceae bacterium]|nr:hypothetical protein [Solirubrobacteraceae bacterium]